jgi:two-component system, chemotaxis family, CheB/CheR fusion protein
MLVGELNHRVKNALATVQAVMTQTLRQSASLGEFTQAFTGRLHALAQAHDLLAAEEWAGTEIGELVSQTLAPYHTPGRGRIVVDGSSLPVLPYVGVALVMIVHELATNAAKYGALSVPTGRVAVAWRREGDPGGDQIHVEWTETGGPRVTPPSRQGFGTKLIERSTAHELGGEARLEYADEGFRCVLIFPWMDISNRTRGPAGYGKD